MAQRAAQVPHRVVQVARLIPGHSPKEREQLKVLVPELRRPPEMKLLVDKVELSDYIQQELSKVGEEYPPLAEDDPFLGGLTVREYFTLTFTGPTAVTLNVTADEESNLFYIEWDSTGYLWGTYTVEAVGDQGSTASAAFEILPAARIYLPLVTKNYQ